MLFLLNVLLNCLYYRYYCIYGESWNREISRKKMKFSNGEVLIIDNVLQYQEWGLMFSTREVYQTWQATCIIYLLNINTYYIL